jgi:acyl-CoA synthetase (AMP-forming)/AMP-acid ligase II
MTYAEVAADVAHVASALAQLGLHKGDRVGVYGANCEEWMIAMQVGCEGERRVGPAWGLHEVSHGACVGFAWGLHGLCMGRMPLGRGNGRWEERAGAAAPERAPPPIPTPGPAPQACNRMSYECVPLYDSLGENAVEFIMRHSEVACVFVAAGKLAKLAPALASLLVRRERRGRALGGACPEERRVRQGWLADAF